MRAIPEETKSFLTAIFKAAVTAAEPSRLIKNHLPGRPKGRTIVVGAGKGAAQMASAFEMAWDGALEGLVVTRYGYASPTSRIEVVEAGHPLPDRFGLEAGKRLLMLVDGLTSDDMVVALIGGGGSALLPAPSGMLTLADEMLVNEVLLASGAPIAVMNAIRKHISLIKGGRLAALAHPAKVISLVTSDIPGENVALVASGPTIPDSTNQQDALRYINDFRIELPEHIMAHIRSPESAAPHPDDPVFAGNEVRLVASAAGSLRAAADEARRRGVRAVILSDAFEGEARDVGAFHATIAREVAMRDQPFAKPVLILSGGETTVTLRGKGRGGRNTEFLLAFSIGIAGFDKIYALAADTDGIDGSEDNAGAFCSGSTVARIQALGIDAKTKLDGNDSWTAFAKIGDLFLSGPTGTNVNDLRAILIR